MRYTSTVKLPLRGLPKDQKVLKGVHLWEAKMLRLSVFLPDCTFAGIPHCNQRWPPEK